MESRKTNKQFVWQFLDENPNYTGKLTTKNKAVYYFLNGKLHSPDTETPAVYMPSSEDKRWCREGVYHKVGGPAIISQNGNNKEWWILGEKYVDDKCEEYIQAVREAKLEGFLNDSE